MGWKVFTFLCALTTIFGVLKTSKYPDELENRVSEHVFPVTETFRKGLHFVYRNINVSSNGDLDGVRSCTWETQHKAAGKEVPESQHTNRFFHSYGTN